MKPPFRVAILECDEPLPGIKKTHGTYGNIFGALLKAGADSLQQPDLITSEGGFEFSMWDVVNEDKYPRLEDIDAVLITGSRFNAFDNDPWIMRLVVYTAKVLADPRVRCIGVCYGHQIIGRALGAPVGRAEEGWETSVTGVELTAKGRELFECGDTLHIHQMHRDAMLAYPSDPAILRLGSTPRCSTQGMYLPRQFISVQGHPEFNEDIMRSLLDARHKQGLFADDMYKEASARASAKQDGVAVSRAFVKFLLEA